MSLAKRERLAVLALLLSGLLWGTSWMPFKHFAAQGLTGLTATLCTYGLVGVVALPLLVRQRARWLGQWRTVAAAGLFGGLANACFVTALMFGDVTRAMLLFYLAPLWGLVGGRCFLGERVTPHRVSAAAMAIAGAVLVLGGPDAVTSTPRWLDVLAIAAGLFYSAQNVSARASDRVPVLPKTLMAFLGCTIVGAVALPFSGHVLPDVSGTVALQLLLFALFWLTAAMWTQTYGVSQLEAGRSGVLVIFELLAAVASAMVVAGERLDTAGWVGAALIVGSAILEARTTSAPDIARGEVA